MGLKKIIRALEIWKLLKNRINLDPCFDLVKDLSCQQTRHNVLTVPKNIDPTRHEAREGRREAEFFSNSKRWRKRKLPAGLTMAVALDPFSIC